MSKRAVVLVALAAILAATVLAACGGSGGTAPLSTCGNGRLDQGELCDDGNTDDTDACTSACKPARCGDGVVQLGTEDCDGFNMNKANCNTLGFSGSDLRCTTTCRFDLSVCGPAFTPTPTATGTPTETPTFLTAPPTNTETPTPTATPNPCGNGILEPGEVCTCHLSAGAHACGAMHCRRLPGRLSGTSLQ